VLETRASRSTSRRRGGGGIARHRALGPIAAGLVVGLIAAGAGGGSALALPTDRAEAEGLLLSGGGLVNLDTIAELEGAYTSFPPEEELNAPIDVTALGAIDLGLGVQLFGGSDVLTLGAVGQYSRSDVTGAYAASGAISDDGAILAGPGAPTTVALAPVLDDLGLEDLVSDLSLELGAVAASATATRGATVTPVGDYLISSGAVTLTAPALGDTAAALDAELADASAAINALAADGGPIDGTVDGLLGGIDAILEDLLLGLVDLVGPEVTTTLAVDLGSALDTVADDPFVSGPLTLTLSTGEVIIDLDQLYALNDLAPNTELLSDGALNPTIAAALDDILTVQLPAAIGDVLDDVLNTTELDIDITAGVEGPLGADLGDLEISVDGTLGGLLGIAGSTAPSVSLGDTDILGLAVGDLLDPVTDYVVGSILPAVGDVLEGAFDLGGLEATLTDALTGTVTALGPVFDAVDEVVSITVNVQETPGEFRDPLGTDAGSFTQRAVTLVVAPDLAGGAIELNLASATVRAVPLAAPADLALSPTRGPVTGGTPVTITGTNLGDTTGVTFGTEPATFTVNPDGTVSAVAPAQAAPGVVPVTITNIDGSDSSLTFEYFNVMSVDAIDPDAGSTLGGDEITITGECFTGATGVTFGGVAGTDFTVVSDTEITVTTPPGAAGLVDVVITNPTECGPITVADGFTYVAPGAPTISDIVPDRGPETGGTTVTITGEDFTGATAVTFDGIEATSFTVVSDTEITAVTPPHAPAIVDVIVTNAAGASAGFDFEYFDVTQIDAVDPDQGPETGGNTVTITGDCFTGATDVLFGGESEISFTVVSDTVITAEVPAGVGVVDVTVVGAGDCGPGTIDEGYEYFAPPVVTDLDPEEGPETGGTVVAITGDGFTGTTGVLFGETPATEFTVLSDTEIEATSPAGAPGVVTVTIEHPGGDTDAGDFEYLDVPSITSLDPAEGPEDGGTVVTIIGEGFTGATGVTFDGDEGTDFVVVSDTEIEVTTPAHAPATVPVVVLHPNGDSEAASFTFIEGTEIDTVTPPGGPEEGGTVVTITGQCFTGATEVLFGTTPAASFTVDSDTQITAVAPPGVGTVDVTVVGAQACGTDTIPDGYEYTDDPVIGTLTPTTGPETGGTVVTITGANFGNVTSVTFDGIPGTGLTIVSDTELRVTTPANAPGDAAVVVTSPDGSSDPGAFRYFAVTVVDGSDPGTGPTGGGTVVTITGQCFTGATAVLFGGVASPSFRVVSDTTILAVTPAASSAGAVTVSVVGAGTCGTGSLPGGFTYVPGAAAGGILPATGGDATGSSPLATLGLMLLTGGALIVAAIRIRRRMA
jgi:hypothetical protein